MDKGYYQITNLSHMCINRVAIHNKNGQGLLLDEIDFLKNKKQGRNPQ